MPAISAIEKKFKKPHLTDVKSGDTVRVHQKIREGAKERIQVFEGLVMRTKRTNSHTASLSVRRVASGVGVEKTYLMHSPLITKIEVVKRSKVRRNYLSYMRDRTGKAARLTGVDFDKASVNEDPTPKNPAKEAASEPAVNEDQAEKPENEPKPEPATGEPVATEEPKSEPKTKAKD